MSELIITVNDCSHMAYCRRGLREFAARHGFDYVDFLKNGIPASKLEHIDDEMVKVVIENARRRSNQS